ncbi:hypothetical protein SDC9_114828 [bioreactor metagenome]|uniref:Uncharacterized protein n=1 Tax=bioreactor metagenome TaxID=1076179 RepID=A0A645BXQ9_9ZZZZ
MPDQQQRKYQPCHYSADKYDRNALALAFLRAPRRDDKFAVDEYEQRKRNNT